MILEGIVIASAILSVLGPTADTIVSSIKNDQNADLDTVRRVVNKALTKAYQENTRLGDSLVNKLASLSIVQRTPALSQAIDRAYDKIKQQKAELDDDYAKKELQAQELLDKVNRAEDANIFTRKSKINDLKEGINEKIQKISNIEERI